LKKPPQKKAAKPKTKKATGKQDLGSDNDDVPPLETSEERIAQAQANEEEMQDAGQASLEIPALETLVDITATKKKALPSPQLALQQARHLQKMMQKAVREEHKARKMAAQKAAEIGIAEKKATAKIALRRKATEKESEALKNQSKQVSSVFKKQVSTEEHRLQQKAMRLQAQAKAQNDIFRAQQQSAKKLRAEVSSASKLAKVRKAKQHLAVQKAALDAQAKTEKSIFHKQHTNTDRLKAEVAVVGKAEKGELQNAEQLGEFKAKAADQAHLILAARENKEHEAALARAQQWTTQKMAHLSKVLVVTKAVDAQIAKRKAALGAAKQRLVSLRKKLTSVSRGQEGVESDVTKIQRSTEELSREELGESSHVSSEADENHEDLGESSEVAAAKTPDSLGVALARMSSQFEGIESTTKKAATEETEMEHDSVKAKKEKKKRAEMKAHKQEMAQKAAQKKKLTKQLASKKQSALEQKLAKEEATLRATTATKVKAQMSLQNAVNAERKHQLKMAKKQKSNYGDDTGDDHAGRIQEDVYSEYRTASFTAES
jgi:hypothetical protein